MAAHDAAWCNEKTSAVLASEEITPMVIEAGKTYFFTKSGNEVRAIAPTTPYCGLAMWEVERTAGASAG